MRLLVLALASLALIALPACGSQHNDQTIDTVYNPCEPLVVVTEPDATAAHIESVDQALRMWNDLAPLQLTRQPVADAPRIPVVFEKGAPFVHGVYEDQTGEVIVNTELSDRERTITVAHELGHAFGLHHVDRDQRRSLMNAGNLETTLTEHDVAVVLQRWNGCQ